MENPIKKIDFTDLRSQKTSLLATIEFLKGKKVPQLPDDLEGILNLIDSIQDYAVDELNVPAIHVFDFELEEEREVETSKKTKSVYLCMHCGSDKVQVKAWVKPNESNMYVDEVEGDELGWCDDCDQTVEVQTAELRADAEVIGFQVVGEDSSPVEGEIHPKMDGSFCIYNLQQANEMLYGSQSDHRGQWRLLTIWEGDIEEPTMMFEGDPRG